MKIAFDYQVFSSQKYGGISRYFFELSQVMGDLSGVDLKIISPFYVNEYLKYKPMSTVGIHVPQLAKTGRIYRAVNKFISSGVMRRYSPDIVHETYYSYAGVAPKHSKVVVTVQDMIHEILPQNFSSRDKTRGEKAASINRADHIICASENTYNDLVEILRVPGDKVSVVHHGFELMFSPSGLRRHKDPYILFVGNRGGYKNFDCLLQAYAITPFLYKNFHLVVFGGGVLTPYEKARINQLSSEGLHIYQQNGDDSVLADLYKFAEVLVYPSLYEGFGIPPLEAMSCGCPVICSNISSIPEVVGDAAVLFEPESVESLVAALLELLDNTPFRNELLVKGYEQCKKFSWRKSAMETLNVYHNILGSKF